MNIDLIDTHCHLNALKPPVEEVIANAARVNVNRIICIGASEGLKSAADAVGLAERFSNVYATVGIHPHDTANSPELTPLEKYLAHPKVVAIGETGLDFFRDWAPKVDQQKVFERTISLAIEHKKPLIIHCREAEVQTLDTLIKFKASTVGGVFHCYAGDSEFAKKLRDLNFLISLTGTLTFKSATQMRETAKAIPLEQIMLETDAPYMAPEPFRGKPSEPMHVYQIAHKLAEIKEISLSEIAKVTTANAVSLFRLQEK